VAFPDVVVLVPGFFGFSRLGGFYYFADRVAATLRGALETAKHRTIPVVPVSCFPTAHLAKRQTSLIKRLRELCDHMGGVTRLHLVGHSAGGVDAQLLTCERPLGKRHWDIDAQRIRNKLATVVGIASPHHGTCLSNAPLARLIADPVQQLLGDPLAQAAMMPSIVRQLGHLSRLAASESEMIWASLLTRLRDSTRFLGEVVRHRGLIDDLAPRAMESTRAHWGKGNVPLRSFVTVAPDPRRFATDGPDRRKAEPFFADLYRLTSDTTGAPTSAALHRAAMLLNARAGGAISSSSDILSFDEHVSDGVVNSTRQLVDPTDPDELAGIVVADHADVLGHYDRTDMFMDDAPLNLGLFHSGAGFNDNQFYTLYDRVAGVLAQQMPSR